MDLAIGAKNVFVMMNLFAKDGVAKLVPECTYPLTGLRCVRRVYNRLRDLRRRPGGGGSRARDLRHRDGRAGLADDHRIALGVCVDTQFDSEREARGADQDAQRRSRCAANNYRAEP